MTNISSKRIKLAWFIAVTADLLQITLFPLFAGGFLSPLDAIMDVIVCLVLTLLIGWHFAFLPSFILEVLPMMDMVPSWSLAMLIVTRRKQVPVQEKTITQVYDNGAVPPPKLLANEIVVDGRK